MARRIAVFGGSFNPPHVSHKDVVRTLSPRFDEVAVVPCGPRPDKATTNDIEPIHRAVMADMTFRGFPNASVRLFDLEQSTFTRTHRLQEMFSSEGEVWHVVGTDLVKGGKDGRAVIQRVWERGDELWRRCNFAVVVRDGYPYDPEDMPPNHLVFPASSGGASSEIRERVFRRQPIDGSVTPEVAAYIDRYNLYRGTIPPRATRIGLADPKAVIVADERNPKAGELAARFRDFEAGEGEANCVIVVGGDGMMLHAIRKHWRLRLPFLGVNAGHKGYLLNDVAELQDPSYLFGELRLQHLPLLYVELTDLQGKTRGCHAFNDAWVERATGQCAWLKVCTDGRVRIPKLVADGALVATAAGSTAYARAMGAKPLLVDAQAYLLVGNNVVSPRDWKSVPLSLDTCAELVSLESDKRPVRAFVDGEEYGPVASMRVRASRVAAVELAFSPHRDMAAKLAEDLFPPIG